jgi:hypothetical protein
MLKEPVMVCVLETRNEAICSVLTMLVSPEDVVREGLI